MISVFLTNLGKYNEGELCGLWVELPATEEQLKEAFKEAQIDGIQYEEYFITDYESDIDDLTECLGEYENIRELNFLAERLEELSTHEQQIYESALSLESANDAKFLINLTYNLDNYYLMTDVNDHDDLGRYYADECCSIDIPENLKNYFDYEAYGRDIDYDTMGTFTEHGYIESSGDSFTEHYSGPEELPDYEPPEIDIEDGPAMKM